MCGICGKLNLDGQKPIAPTVLKRMGDAIFHRGPDDEGYYVSDGVGFAFRRLAIIDLNTGHQPISNEDGTVWIVFNGEIYNYRDLREELQKKGHIFRTQTDTEVIVHLYEEYGEGCVKKLRGMFAFSIWDDRQRVLLLARDRIGIKPLYYRLTDDSLIFGSEIKAILADPEVQTEVLPQMVDRFLTFYFVPGEETLLRDIKKLPPASYMVVKNGRAEMKSYWELSYATSPITVKEAEEELLKLLEESVRLHMIADVPVGFLLSGGVDSTAMLDFAVGKTKHDMSSFTLGFSDGGVADERPYAKLAARQYGTRHYETTITAREFTDFLPQFAWHMEEPVCEPQAVALYYVSKLAKGVAKVLISGEGGDEAFAGYQTYRGILWLERLKRVLGIFNLPFSSQLVRANHFVKSARISKYAPLMALPFESYFYSRTSSPFHYFNSHVDELYSKDFASHVDKSYSLSVMKRFSKGESKHIVNQMLYVDTKTSLPDDLLLKADKMTMANSIELRVPFLDHKIIEFAATLPENLKIHGFTTKYIAKRALRHRVPPQILRRRKAGFPVPYESWFRRELKGWLRDTLLDRSTVSRGYFDRTHIEKMISLNAENGGLSRELFSLAALEFWHRSFANDTVQSTSSTERCGAMK